MRSARNGQAASHRFAPVAADPCSGLPEAVRESGGVFLAQIAFRRQALSDSMKFDKSLKRV